jgi:hypothetical protein
MKKILAIGGAVIKTALDPLKNVLDDVEILIHNGGSLFHDFQIAIGEFKKGETSYTLDKLLVDFKCNEAATKKIWKWIDGGLAPKNSVTRMCENRGIPVLVFTGLGCDFWQMFGHNWEIFARKTQSDFLELCERFKKPFHYICAGSGVIHPEVFVKALAISHPKDFRADVVDFKIMYRPISRVAVYGDYFLMEHKEFFKLWSEKSL